jgi:hypothetical protein
MLHASDSNATSSVSEDSDSDSAHKNEDSDDDGSQRPSPSLFRQEQADKNADAIEDDDGEDDQSDYGSISELCSDSEDDEYYQQFESTSAAQFAAAVSQESLLDKFSELTRQFATLVE